MDDEVSIEWVDCGKWRYIKATGFGEDWCLDPNEGDTIESLRNTAKLFNAVADWQEQNERP